MTCPFYTKKDDKRYCSCNGEFVSVTKEREECLDYYLSYEIHSVERRKASNNTELDIGNVLRSEGGFVLVNLSKLSPFNT